jgi:hypothetical protein
MPAFEALAWEIFGAITCWRETKAVELVPAF